MAFDPALPTLARLSQRILDEQWTDAASPHAASGSGAMVGCVDLGACVRALLTRAEFRVGVSRRPASKSVSALRRRLPRGGNHLAGALQSRTAGSALATAPSYAKPGLGIVRSRSGSVSRLARGRAAFEHGLDTSEPLDPDSLTNEACERGNEPQRADWVRLKANGELCRPSIHRLEEPPGRLCRPARPLCRFADQFSGT